MPYAIHFDGGNAIHSTEPRFYHLLGKRRASHGCVRTYLEHAKEINELVWMHGRRFPTLSEMEPGATAVTAAPPRARRQSFDYSNTLICVR